MVFYIIVPYDYHPPNGGGTKKETKKWVEFLE